MIGRHRVLLGAIATLALLQVPVAALAITVCGDVDLNDQFAASDVDVLRTFLVALPTPGLDLVNGPSAVRCDVDNDVSCDVVDLVRFRRHLDSLPGPPFGLCANLVLPPGVTADPGPFDVSGTIVAAAGQFVDSDVNDVFTTPVSNNTSLDAQVIPVPATVGGYANLPGFGPPGNSQLLGDDVDLYSASLLAGQGISLLLGDPNQIADLDLVLFDPNGSVVAFSATLDQVEQVVVPFSGDFFIGVFPYDDPNFPFDVAASTYVLSVGQTAGGTAAGGVNINDEFVAGQVIVRPKVAPHIRKTSLGAPASSFEGRFAMRAVAGAESCGMLFELGRDEAELEHTFETLGAAAQRRTLHARLPGLDAEARRRLDTILAVKALRRRSDVETADLNYIRRATLTPNDVFYGFQWHYPLISAPAAWDVTTGDPNTIVAVVDTGILLNHPDLQGQLIAGYDFIADPNRSLDGDGIDADPNDPGDLSQNGTSSSFHGTHVAGTIGAATNNATGVAGVAWDVSIMPIRALGLGGSGTSFDIQQGVLYTARLPNASATLPPARADILNLSLGGGGGSPTEQAIYTQVRNEGVIIIAAAGNDNSPVPSYPASYNGVVSVSAVDLNKNKAPYSNFGSTVDVAAPGGDTSVDLNGDTYADGVLSPLADDSGGNLIFSYVFYQGTSMAAPHVAGVAALMKAENPALTPADFDMFLAGGALTDDLGAAGRDDIFGHGLINALKAVTAAGGTPLDFPILSVTPTSFGFGATLTESTLQVENAGGGTLEISSVTEDSGGWLSVAADSVDGDGLGTYSVTVDRAGLTAGTYNATITVSSTSGNQDVPVSMSVAGPGVPTLPDAGFHFLLLIDAATSTIIDQANIPATAGTYPFTFTDVSEGEYLLVGGTDLDNDGVICDGGEACASFPTLDLPEPVVVQQDLSGLSFVTGFSQSVVGTAAGAARQGDFQGYELLRPKPALE
jgi:serine protease